MRMYGTLIVTVCISMVSRSSANTTTLPPVSVGTTSSILNALKEESLMIDVDSDTDRKNVQTNGCRADQELWCWNCFTRQNEDHCRNKGQWEKCGSSLLYTCITSLDYNKDKDNYIMLRGCSVRNRCTQTTEHSCGVFKASKQPCVSCHTGLLYTDYQCQDLEPHEPVSDAPVTLKKASPLSETSTQTIGGEAGTTTHLSVDTNEGVPTSEMGLPLNETTESFILLSMKSNKLSGEQLHSPPQPGRVPDDHAHDQSVTDGDYIESNTSLGSTPGGILITEYTNFTTEGATAKPVQLAADVLDILGDTTTSTVVQPDRSNYLYDTTEPARVANVPFTEDTPVPMEDFSASGGFIDDTLDDEDDIDMETNDQRGRTMDDQANLAANHSVTLLKESSSGNVTDTGEASEFQFSDANNTTLNEVTESMTTEMTDAHSVSTLLLRLTEGYMVTSGSERIMDETNDTEVSREYSRDNVNKNSMNLDNSTSMTGDDWNKGLTTDMVTETFSETSSDEVDITMSTTLSSLCGHVVCSPFATCSSNETHASVCICTAYYRGNGSTCTHVCDLGYCSENTGCVTLNSSETPICIVRTPSADAITSLTRLVLPLGAIIVTIVLVAVLLFTICIKSRHPAPVSHNKLYTRQPIPVHYDYYNPFATDKSVYMNYLHPSQRMMDLNGGYRYYNPVQTSGWSQNALQPANRLTRVNPWYFGHI